MTYCLEYSERLNIKDKNLEDVSLYDSYCKETNALIGSICKPEVMDSKNVFILVSDVLNSIYQKQGLEFADFILYGKGVCENLELHDIITEVVIKHSITSHVLELKQCLLTIINHGLPRYH
jgi:hypothetical protein